MSSATAFAFQPAQLVDQGRQDFVPGLSVLDAVFHLGWDGAAALIAA